MQNCLQTEGQSIFEHGISVKNHTFELINSLKTGISNYKLPDWFFSYKEELLNNLYPLEIIEEYTIFHDVSKPYCRELDSKGNQHFPNHAELSGKIWLENNGSPIVANLMRMDMDIHLFKSNQLKEFASRPEAVTLLMVGLSEVIANAKIFGGFESISFKIKYKNISKNGKFICKELFGDK